jgi:putative ABC transport system ATP-binding protein
MIELDGVERVFQVGGDAVYALCDIHLRFASGAYTAIMGPSGSGKSTLLNILGLLDRPSRGTYRLDGVDTTVLDDRGQAWVRRHKVGFVFQSFHLVPRLTAAGNVELPLLLAGIAPVERRARVARALANMGLTDRADHRPDQLSGGQRQRVAIARAVIMQPEMILADEPTGNLDHISGRGVIETLEALNQQGIALLVVTHDPEIARRARRCVRMSDGRIAEDSAAT